MTTHEDKMGVARLYVLNKAPYFSSVVYGFIFQPLPGIRTMLVTAGMVLGYDPAWVERATIEELGADIVHEVHHFVRRHFLRTGMADRHLFNIAGDLAINPDLRNGGWKLAKDAIFPSQPEYGFPDGLTTEEYYDRLLQQKMRKEQQPKGSEDSNGSGGSKSGDSDKNGAQGGDQDGGSGQSGEGQQKGVGSGCCGSISGNPSDLEKMLEAMPDITPRTEVEVHAIELRAAKEFKEYAAKHGAGRGTAPSFMEEWLKALEEQPLVPWEQELSDISRDCVGRLQSGGDDYSLRRPSKRSYLRGGLIRPGLIEYLPEVAMILDTSGSMGMEQILAVVREVIGLMEALGIDEVWWCEADAGVAMDWQRVQLEFFRDLKIKGRGGTDFRPAIASAQDLYPQPDLLFYGTDGDGTAPAQPPPNMEVVWCIVPSHYNKPAAPWGHTVFATNDRALREKFNNSKPMVIEEYDDDIG